MVKDAEANKEADKKKRDTVDTRNQVDSMIFSTESLKEHGDKITADEKAIESAISDLRNSLKGTDNEDVKKKHAKFNPSINVKLGSRCIKPTKDPTKEKSDPENKSKKDEKDNVVDADLNTQKTTKKRAL